MTTPPKLVLPSQAMPWGRWVVDETARQNDALDAIRGDANSAGNVFASAVGTLGRQISGVSAVSAIYDREIPQFTVTRSGTANVNVFDSAAQTFSPPEPDRSYRVSVVANINATSTFPLNFAYSILRVNGTEYQFRHDNGSTGTSGSLFANFSAMGGVDIAPSEPVNIQFAIAASGAGTLTFTGCKLTAIFNGSILV